MADGGAGSTGKTLLCAFTHESQWGSKPVLLDPARAVTNGLRCLISVRHRGKMRWSPRIHTDYAESKLRNSRASSWQKSDRASHQSRRKFQIKCGTHCGRPAVPGSSSSYGAQLRLGPAAHVERAKRAGFHSLTAEQGCCRKFPWRERRPEPRFRREPRPPAKAIQGLAPALRPYCPQSGASWSS